MSTRFKLCVLTLSIAIVAIGVTDAYTIDISYNGNVGTYLVNENRLTLYRHQGDGAGYSNVNSNDWPPFYTATVEVPGSLNRYDFRTIRRSDGTLQTTYKDWPLYLYKNRGPGDISGNGVNNMYVVSPTIGPLE